MSLLENCILNWIMPMKDIQNKILSFVFKENLPQNSRITVFVYCDNKAYELRIKDYDYWICYEQTPPKRLD